jgi:hypothetical protein
MKSPEARRLRPTLPLPDSHNARFEATTAGPALLRSVWEEEFAGGKRASK